MKPAETNCHYCHRVIVGKQITKDHIVAKINGGTDDALNIVWACKPCNSLKSDHPVEMFLEFLAQLSKEDSEELSTFSLQLADDWAPEFRKLMSRFSKKYNRWAGIVVREPVVKSKFREVEGLVENETF